MNAFIELHAIQTPGPACINRDDVGAPKDVRFGGADRARISSQCWKRAVRLAMDAMLGEDSAAIRTSRVNARLSGMLADRGVAADDAQRVAIAVLDASGALPQNAGDDEEPADGGRKKRKAGPKLETDALLLMGNRVYKALADAGAEAWASGDAAKWCADHADDLAGAVGADRAVDVALFGRMSTMNPAINRDAACQFAHAIAVNTLSPEADFFTAVDEVKESSGAGMMGDVEFNASTFYRFADIDLTRLAAQIGAADAVEAAAAFVRAFALAMPSGRANGFANTTPPDFLAVIVRPGRPFNLVGAFVEPVDRGDIPMAAVGRLSAKESEYESNWGGAPAAVWHVGREGEPGAAAVFGPRVGLDELVSGVRGAVAKAVES